jgi:pimeloyl-ACP methyl ester carboxylesterase
LFQDVDAVLTDAQMNSGVNVIEATLELEDGSTLSYEAWGESTDRPVVLLNPANVDPGPLRTLAEKLSSDFFVEMVPLPGDKRGGDWTSAALDKAGAPALVVGYGQSCRAAFVSTRLRTVRALAVIDASLPHPDTDTPGVSTLIIRGRQAERFTHEAAVSLMNRLPGSRLYELEDCADDPAVEAPDALETTIRWFMDHLPEDGPIEFPEANPGDSLNISGG